MAVRKFKPTTPGQRHKVIGVFKGTITATTPEKSLTVGKKSSGGRNAEGHLTNRYLGGGHKRKYRIIDFKRNKDGVPAVVKSIEYDPNRSARIALLYYVDGAKAYIIAPNGLEVGAKVMSGAEAAPEVGNSLPLKNIPVGTLIHCIELRPGQGAFMDPQDPGRMQGYGRRRGQQRALAGAQRQSRTLTLAGPSSAQPRRRDEPCRPPDGRRRGTRFGRTPAFAQGSLQQGSEDTCAEEELFEVHY